MSRLTDLIAPAKAKDPQLGADLDREFKQLSSRASFAPTFFSSPRSRMAVWLPISSIRTACTWLTRCRSWRALRHTLEATRTRFAASRRWRKLRVACAYSISPKRMFARRSRQPRQQRRFSPGRLLATTRRRPDRASSLHRWCDPCACRSRHGRGVGSELPTLTDFEPVGSAARPDARGDTAHVSSWP